MGKTTGPVFAAAMGIGNADSATGAAGRFPTPNGRRDLVSTTLNMTQAPAPAGGPRLPSVKGGVR
jgi:hypothetical protein